MSSSVRNQCTTYLKELLEGLFPDVTVLITGVVENIPWPELASNYVNAQLDKENIQLPIIILTEEDNSGVTNPWESLLAYQSEVLSFGIHYVNTINNMPTVTVSGIGATTANTIPTVEDVITTQILVEGDNLVSDTDILCVDHINSAHSVGLTKTHTFLGGTVLHVDLIGRIRAELERVKRSVMSDYSNADITYQLLPISPINTGRSLNVNVSLEGNTLPLRAGRLTLSYVLFYADGAF